LAAECEEIKPGHSSHLRPLLFRAEARANGSGRMPGNKNKASVFARLITVLE
jgi:hypothetical protein